ncbi:hypothetical protein VTL71DRAFT_2522 [Oculimacula yallundae]|uniref:TauD/TfdA-like domain-containing protein n=1 Tax=Oculimacula yallundae TaxID=86028 RepID=A0ABR4CB20_9HELO
MGVSYGLKDILYSYPSNIAHTAVPHFENPFIGQESPEPTIYAATFEFLMELSASTGGWSFQDGFDLRNKRRLLAKFSLKNYLNRGAVLAAGKRKENGASSPNAREGFPDQISLPAVWTFDILSIDLRLTPPEVEELENALYDFNSQAYLIPQRYLSQDLSAPDTWPKLRALSLEIHEGKGTIIVKGLQPDNYSLKDNIMIFAGLSSYIDDQRGSQSAQNDVMMLDPRPGFSDHGLPFHHDDHCDILALYVIETAHYGGTTRWALFGPLKVTKSLPLMFIDDRRIPFMNFTRFGLTGLPTYPRSPNSPKLTLEQADALDTIQYLAAKVAVDVKQEKGDILLINNRAVLHARDKIQDHLGDSARHLIRLCLRDSEYGRPIPENLKRRWGIIFDENQHEHGKWMLNKENDLAFVSNVKFDSALSEQEISYSHG